MHKYMDDITPHRSKSKKNKSKKSDHKHDYRLVEIKEWKIEKWFTHKRVCQICGKENNQLRIEK